ncbi:MAG TPA: HTH domain-containing protein, partial [bacterium]|nr:HTH domain-containing protein [bacterium]
MSPRRAPSPSADQQPATSIEAHVHAVVTILRALATELPVPQLDLEERLGVSGRTLRRYIAALKSAGFDIQTRRGQGYQLRFVPENWQGFLPASVVAELASLRVMEHALPIPQSRAQAPLAALVDELLRGASGDLAKVEERLKRAIAWREEVPRK